jgi:predicted metal-dependent hydrolase
MKLELNNVEYSIEIIKKITTKNTYIRVKEDLTIVVTTNSFTSDRKIMDIINQNLKSIERMLEKTKSKREYNSNFYYLGKKYDVVYTNSSTIEFGNTKVFVGKNINLENILKKQASILFQQRLDLIHSSFSKKIPYPSLTIRKMKSRWGVCNTKTKRITLNLELIKKDICCLDYVIVHELSHLIHADHSKNFWLLVEENFKDYKKVRKQMKEY